MKVAKFGGSSLATPLHIKRVGQIIQGLKIDLVVVSAIGKTTRHLLDLHRRAQQKEPYDAALANLISFHEDIFQKTAHDTDKNGPLLRLFEGLRRDLRGETSLPEAALKDRILSYGEYLSSFIISAAFPALKRIDAPRFLHTDGTHGQAKPLWDRTKKCLQQGIDPKGGPYITQGFIGQGPGGHLTTLGFEGSDYSAALFAAGLTARELTIWTDVAGVYTADPRIVKTAQPLPALSYDVAGAISSHGGKVLHPRTIAPVRDHHIPLWVKSSLMPTRPGTKITATPTPAWALTCPGKENTVALINTTLSQRRSLQEFFDFTALTQVDPLVWVAQTMDTSADNMLQEIHDFLMTYV